VLPAIFLLFFGEAAFAGNAAPLGFEIGVATVEQVEERIGTKSDLKRISSYPNWGTVLKGSGVGLGVAGLHEITFVFDASKILIIVVMELTLDYQDIFKTLSGKYKLFDKRGDLFLDGQAHAQFQQGDSYISLMAKNKGTNPDVYYIAGDVWRQAKSRQDQEEAKKAQEKREADAAF